MPSDINLTAEVETELTGVEDAVADLEDSLNDVMDNIDLSGVFDQMDEMVSMAEDIGDIMGSVDGSTSAAVGNFDSISEYSVEAVENIQDGVDHASESREEFDTLAEVVEDVEPDVGDAREVIETTGVVGVEAPEIQNNTDNIDSTSDSDDGSSAPNLQQAVGDFGDIIRPPIQQATDDVRSTVVEVNDMFLSLLPKLREVKGTEPFGGMVSGLSDAPALSAPDDSDDGYSRKMGGDDGIDIGGDDRLMMAASMVQSQDELQALIKKVNPIETEDEETRGLLDSLVYRVTDLKGKQSETPSTLKEFFIKRADDVFSSGGSPKEEEMVKRLDETRKYLDHIFNETKKERQTLENLQQLLADERAMGGGGSRRGSTGESEGQDNWESQVLRGSEEVNQSDGERMQQPDSSFLPDLSSFSDLPDQLQNIVPDIGTIKDDLFRQDAVALPDIGADVSAPDDVSLDGFESAVQQMSPGEQAVTAGMPEQMPDDSDVSAEQAAVQSQRKIIEQTDELEGTDVSMLQDLSQFESLNEIAFSFPEEFKSVEDIPKRIRSHFEDVENLSDKTSKDLQTATESQQVKQSQELSGNVGTGHSKSETDQKQNRGLMERFGLMTDQQNQMVEQMTGMQKLLAGGGAVGIAGLALFGIMEMASKMSGLANASPFLGSLVGMFGQAISLFFRPFGDMLAALIAPAMYSLMEMAVAFNQNFAQHGLLEALMMLGEQLLHGFVGLISWAIRTLIIDLPMAILSNLPQILTAAVVAALLAVLAPIIKPLLIGLAAILVVADLLGVLDETLEGMSIVLDGIESAIGLITAIFALMLAPFEALYDWLEDSIPEVSIPDEVEDRAGTGAERFVTHPAGILAGLFGTVKLGRIIASRIPSLGVQNFMGVISQRLPSIGSSGLMSAIAARLPTLAGGAFTAAIASRLPSLGVSRIIGALGLRAVASAIAGPIGAIVMGLDLLAYMITGTSPIMWSLRAALSGLRSGVMMLWDGLTWLASGIWSIFTLDFSVPSFGSWTDYIPSISTSGVTSTLLPSIGIYDALSGMFAFINSPGMSISEFLGGLFSFIGTGLSTFVSTLFDGAMSIPGMEAASNALDTIVSMLVYPIQPFIDAGSWAFGMIAMILFEAYELWENLWDWASDLELSDIFDGAMDLSDSALDLGEKAVDDIISGTVSIWDYATDSGGDLWSWLSDGTADLWSWLSDGTAQLWSWISTGTSQLWSWLTTGTAQLWNWLSSGTAQLWSWLSTGTSQLWPWLSTGTADLWNWVSSGTADLWNWITGGVSGVGSKLFDWLTDGAVAISDWVSDTIPSPSDLMSEVGDRIPTDGIPSLDNIESRIRDIMPFLDSDGDGSMSDQAATGFEEFAKDTPVLSQAHDAGQFTGDLSVDDMPGGSTTEDIGGTVKNAGSSTKDTIEDAGSSADDFVFGDDDDDDDDGLFGYGAEGGISDSSPELWILGEAGENEAIVPFSKIGDFVGHLARGESPNGVIPGGNSVPIPDIGSDDDNEPDIPMLATGGIATGPTTAIIGEGGEDEAVLPLSKMDSFISEGISQLSESDMDIIPDSESIPSKNEISKAIGTDRTSSIPDMPSTIDVSMGDVSPASDEPSVDDPSVIRESATAVAEAIPSDMDTDIGRDVADATASDSNDIIGQQDGPSASDAGSVGMAVAGGSDGSAMIGDVQSSLSDIEGDVSEIEDETSEVDAATPQIDMSSSAMAEASNAMSGVTVDEVGENSNRFTSAVEQAGQSMEQAGGGLATKINQSTSDITPDSNEEFEFDLTVDSLEDDIDLDFNPTIEVEMADDSSLEQSDIEAAVSAALADEISDVEGAVENLARRIRREGMNGETTIEISAKDLSKAVNESDQKYNQSTEVH